MKPTQFLKKPKEPVKVLPKDFIANQKLIYENQLFKHKLSVRLGTIEDREAVIELRNRRFKMPNTYSSHWLHQLFNFGSCIILENTENEIAGYKFESTYSTFKGNISFTGGTAVASEYANRGLGKILIGYSHLVAMEKGAMANKGIININNYSSVANFINHFGGVFTEFEADFKDYGPRLFYTIPLDEQTPYRQLDLENIHHFLKNYEAKKDYHLIECSDVEYLEKVYSNTDFRIIALLNKEFYNNKEEVYLAVEV